MKYNEVSQHFNLKLKEALTQLRNDLPLAAITYVDIYSPKYSLFQNPKKYGESNHDQFFPCNHICRCLCIINLKTSLTCRI